MTKSDAKIIAEMIRKCWEYECDSECPYYDYTPDEGFRCTRYKFFDRLEWFLDECVEKFEEETDDR